MWSNQHYAELDGISPQMVQTYLLAHGWEKIEPYGDKADFFALGHDGPQILVLASSHFSDYNMRLWQILDTLSNIEERDSLEILRDLSWASFDMVRVGNVESMEDDWIPVDKGLGLIQESRNLLWASAYSVISPQPAFLTRGTAEVVEYLRAVQLSPTGQNGFLVNLLSPIEPFPRRAVEMLTTGLQATREAAIQVNRSTDFRDFEDWVSMGVSANLCSAVGNLVDYENGSGLNISIQWALVKQGPESSSNFRFTKSDAPALKEAASILKDRREHDDERISGYVTGLARRVLNRQGSVTIRSVFGKGHRNIRVNFNPDDYSRIAQAHDNRRVVSVVGSLKPSARGWILNNPRNLVVNGENANE